eukprot:TRINITY_DN7569_c0_g1_i1.p1 TRINITY_DN7569_c0_g1~~TRINITY_DN7569_c0_g1_i1.p1  ORF type:complete len:426 (-),score=90.19 TRINITY_DN7569_c0_g1_i1:63-1340(-)
MVLVKVSLNNDVRRIQITPSDYATLKRHLADHFALGCRPFAIRYVDDENDAVSITCDSELAEALHFVVASATRPFLRLSIHPQDHVSPSNDTSNSRGDNNKPKSTVRHAAFCNNCRKTIVGIRYKCGTCFDYDLCEACEATFDSSDHAVHDASHLFVKVRRTNPHLGCDALLRRRFREDKTAAAKDVAVAKQPDTNQQTPAGVARGPRTCRGQMMQLRRLQRQSVKAEIEAGIEEAKEMPKPQPSKIVPLVRLVPASVFNNSKNATETPVSNSAPAAEEHNEDEKVPKTIPLTKLVPIASGTQVVSTPATEKTVDESTATCPIAKEDEKEEKLMPLMKLIPVSVQGNSTNTAELSIESATSSPTPAPAATSSVAPDEPIEEFQFAEQLATLKAMGFDDAPTSAARFALKQTDGDVEAAINWLLNF